MALHPPAGGALSLVRPRMAPMLSLLSILVASAASSPHGEVEGPALLVQDAAAFELAGHLQHGGLFALPSISESERVPRAVPHRGEIVLRVAAGAGALRLDGLDVRVVEHALDARVAITQEGEACLVSEGVPPRRLEASAGDAAFVARQDGNAIGAGRCTLFPPASAPPDARLVWTAAEGCPDEGTTVTAPDGTRHRLPGPAGGRALVLRPGSDGPSTFELGSGTELDRVEYARVEALEPSGLARLRLVRTVPVGSAPPGGTDLALPVELAPDAMVELAFAAPTPSAQTARAWTAIVDVRAEWHAAEAHERPGTTTTPVEAGAHGAPDGARFVDAGRTAGVSAVHLEGPAQQLDIRPTMGPGAAWGDVDGDGWPDLYLVQGAGREGMDPLPNRLLRNTGEGRFEDVTAASGTGDAGAGMGALFFDAEGDGDLDLYVANYGADALYRNDGGGRFTRVADFDGGDRWSASICAADVDRDGDLDLYVTSYLRFDLDAMPSVEELGRYQREDPIAMLPFAFPGEANRFLRNESTGERLCFVDATDELGLADPEGRGMQAVFWDFDRDGDDDLYVANDVSFNALFRNEGDGTFADVSFSTGLDDPRGGMGLAVGDVDEDGDEDLFLTNWQLEANALYLNGVHSTSVARRRSTFHDGTVAAGLGPAGIGVTSWGTELFDADDDGDLDLFVANGYTSPDYASTGICVGQPNHYFEGDGQGRFTERSSTAGEALAVALPSRAAVACDYDRDGRVDLLVTANNGRAQLLRNETPHPGHWLGIALRARGANPFAIGAEVTVRAGERTWRRSLRAGTGYLGGNAPELHFGLGTVDRVDEIVVRWPSGTRSRHPAPAVDAFARIEEPGP